MIGNSSKPFMTSFLVSIMFNNYCTPAPNSVLHTVAIDKAYDSSGLLHRDISYGNVMIAADGRGVLTDWDHAGTKEDLVPGIVSS